jgi:hypothetical protein
MSDIDTDISAANGSYADDTRIWNRINLESNELNLQHELDKVYDWAVTNNMTFIPTKFELLSFGHSHQDPTYNSSDHNLIAKKPVVKDLGVTFQDNLQFKMHILNVVKKGHKLANWALRVFSTRNDSVLLAILKSLVLPQVEYACQLWAPSDQH